MRYGSSYITIALVYFLIATFLGVILRIYPISDIIFQYKHLVHTHSHIALLGWVYIVLTTLLYKTHLKSSIKRATYKRVFWFTQFTIIGMLFSFPFQGYALFSIIFSTLFLMASYIFTWLFFKYIPKKLKELPSYSFIKAGLIYMLLSSVGPWVLGGIMTTLGSTSIWYKTAIYFYLHFQYNGWFLITLTGIFLYTLEATGFHLPKSKFRLVFLLLNLGVVFSFFLSVLWTEPNYIFHILGGFGAIVQITAFIVLTFCLPKMRTLKNTFGPLELQLLKIGYGLLLFKMLLQLISSIPYFAMLAYRISDFVIGYLHLTFLGVVSLFIFTLLSNLKLLQLSKSGFYVYLFGFILSEVLIFYKGATIWLGNPLITNYTEVLALFSLFMPLGLLILFVKK